MSKVKNMVDEVVEDVAEQVDPDMPDYTSPKWTEFFLEQLTDEELPNGNPSTAGIRRVAQDLFADIYFSDSDVITDSKEKATVKHTLSMKRYSDGQDMTISAVVDARYDKTPYPFKEHLVSTACTRSEGKALRRALKLNVHTAEELDNTDDSGTDMDMDKPINDQQILGLKSMCKRLDVDLVKFVKSNSKKATSIKAVRSVEARLMMAQLSEFQREAVPEEFVGWNEGWEQKFGS